MKINPQPKTRAGRILFYFILLLGFEVVLIWLPITLAGKELPSGLWTGWPMEIVGALVIAIIFEFVLPQKEEKEGHLKHGDEGNKDG